MFTESVRALGSLEVKLLDESGTLKDIRNVNNLVVAVGKDVIASRLVGNAIAVPSYMAVGSSATAAAASQTALGGELGRVTLDSTTRSSNTIAYAATFGAGIGTGALTEAGIFNAVSSGNMLCRTTFSTVTKASGDTVVITWNLTIA
jgi:hypothetical protein